MARKIDWIKIKSDYTQGVDRDGKVSFPTLEELSVLHNVSQSTLRKRSAAEDWTTSKNMFKSHLEQKRREKRTEVLAGKAAEFDADIFKVVSVGVRHIQGHFLAVEQRFIDSQGREPMGVNMLNQLAMALDRLQKVGRLALGEPTEIGGETGDESRQQLIRNIVEDTTLIERIADNYRQRVRKSPSED